MLEPFIYSDISNTLQRLSFSRLYSEYLTTIGYPQQAYDVLSGVLATIESAKTAQGVALSQALSTQVWHLTKLGRYAEAEIQAADVLRDSIASTDRLGRAIIQTRSGVLKLLQCYNHQAVEAFEAGLLGFKESGDERGQAWCLGYVALAQLKLKHTGLAIEAVQLAMRIHSEAQACSIDYYEVLAEFMSHGGRLRALVEQEYLRVRTMLGGVGSSGERPTRLPSSRTSP